LLQIGKIYGVVHVAHGIHVHKPDLWLIRFHINSILDRPANWQSTCLGVPISS
jgi:hypothetical protein